jgi:CheY-like chemotaxis protein
MRILVAEDDPVSRRLLETLLNHCRYDAVARTDVREALSAGFERRTLRRSPSSAG